MIFTIVVLRPRHPHGKRERQRDQHMHALRSRERGCFFVVQTLWAEKIQSTTNAGSLNTFGRDEIEVAPISSALLRIACLVILYKAITATNRTVNRGAGTSQRPAAFSV